MTRDINPNWKPATLAVHVGEGIDAETRAIRRPIHMANSYELPTDIEELLKTLSWDHLDKFHYTREHSPTPRHLEERLARLEGGEDCVVTASGMGAVAAVFFTLLQAGDHVVASEVCYTGTQKLLARHLPRFGVKVSLVDTTDAEAVAGAVRPETKLVFVETPGNPIVAISDIARIAELAHAGGAILIVDSTWSGLVGQSPLELGADLVLHSATKYINGHGDALGGAVIGPRKILNDVREYGVVHLGACLSPFNAWLILRGSVTLPLRLRRHSDNALRVAEFLDGHPEVLSVSYPGLPGHPGHDLAKRQMKAFSGMLNFNLKTDLLGHFEFLKRLKLITHAVSLGHDQSLIIYIPTAFFFEDMVVMDEAQKARYTRIMGEGIFRLSVGLEDPDDLVGDLKAALETVP
ncbi:MAG: aminotransferase class I/II-fold pyridoxal phosphate-dependent enzyme [Thermodesulfobacteriota bacterium]